jgi:hypothetical protein
MGRRIRLSTQIRTISARPHPPCNSTLPLPGLSPVSGKSVVATFDGGLLSSDGGVLMLREVEQRLRIADRFAGWIEDQRAPDRHLPDRERARRPRPAAHGSRHGRSLLRVFPASSHGG